MLYPDTRGCFARPCHAFQDKLTARSTFTNARLAVATVTRSAGMASAEPTVGGKNLKALIEVKAY